MRRTPSATGLLLVLLCMGILIVQAMIRPAVGIANNGDFPKMAGPLALAPPDGSWEAHEFHEFVYQYAWAERFRWRNAYFSSEFWFLRLARGLQRLLRPGPRFDIRWLGTLHGLILLLGVGLWIYALDRRWRLWGGLWVIFIWTDVAYVQYLNSMYTDAVALVALVLAAAAGLHAARHRDRKILASAMIAALLLFAASKAQHALAALLFLPLFLGFAWSSRDRAARALWLSGSVLLVGAVMLPVYHTPDDYKNIGVFDLVFLRLAPQAPQPSVALNELGLGSDELPYLGMHAFLLNAPIQNPAWAQRFQARCNYSTISRYYLRHPSFTLRVLYRNLSGQAAQMEGFANRSLDDGFPKDTRDTRFGYWSGLRAFLLRRAPWHIPLFLLIAAGGAIWLLLRSPADRALAGLALTFQALAVTEYGISVLADAVETWRHLLLFHAAVDVSILLLPLLIARIYSICRGRAAFSTG